MSKYREIELSNIKTYPITARQSKVQKSAFAAPGKVDMDAFFACLPDILMAHELKELIEACRKAKAIGKPVIIGLGGHVIKCGLAPLLIELMDAGYVKAFVCNGAVAIHDFEIACFGQTSEDVAAALADGSFGMAEDTALFLNNAIINGYEKGLGMGEAIGAALQEKAAYPELSLLASAYKRDIPVCVQVAIGTDIIHQSPHASGKAIGDTSMRDFRIFCHMVSTLDEGGVFINLGSAVIVPEVFLKALSVARNLNGKVSNFTTAVFDMNMHYRARVNVAERPVLTGGKGYYFIGHHELMIPLLVKALV
ncbi:MAG: hypothetical protein KA984_02550 [Candidatus Cloacimonetes bacterium]|nr:hypothetical protein [Candidatus Cloacimonadota bacterium]